MPASRHITMAQPPQRGGDANLVSLARAMKVVAMEFDAGRWASAIPLLTKSVSLAEKLDASATLSAARARLQLGECYARVGSFSVALPHAIQARDTLASLDQGNSSVIETLAWSDDLFGQIFVALGRDSEATSSFESAASRFELVSQPRGLISALSRLATQQAKPHQYTKALRSIERAEALSLECPRSTSEEQRQTISMLRRALHMLMPGGAALRPQRDDGEVKLAALQRQFGASSEEAAMHLLAMSATCTGNDDISTAIGHVRRAIGIFNHLGNSKQVADSEGLLSILYDMAGDFEAALPLAERTLASQRKLLPPDHPSLAATLKLLAGIHSGLGRAAPAAAVLEAAAAIDRRSQTRCAVPGCEQRVRADGSPLDVCIKCRRTFYCGKACQTTDWKREGGHKAECKALIAEAAAAAAAGTQLST